MAEIKRVNGDERIDNISKILETDGCIIINDLLQKESILNLKNELLPYFQRTSLCHGDFFGHQTKRLSGLVTKSNVCKEICINPTILSIIDAFLLKGCKEYQLNLTQAISIGPGEPEQIIHSDDLMFPFEHSEHEAMINCMWAVDDFTTENGATCVVPGSHKWQKGRRPNPDEVIQGAMPAGSVLIYLGSLLHGGGANKSDTSRIGVVLSYCLGWLRQAENHFLAVPLGEAAKLPERLQKLLGYFVHKPNLGCIEGQDPIRLLRHEAVQDVGFEEFLLEEVRPLLEAHRQKVRSNP